jgi:hypothetical protein
VRQLASVTADRHVRLTRGVRSSRWRHSSKRSDCMIAGLQARDNVQGQVCIQVRQVGLACEQQSCHLFN